MDKISMRDWVANLEGFLDSQLSKWHKINKIENGEAVQLGWKWEQTRFILNVFWEDKKEFVSLYYLSPRIAHTFHWHGLDNKTVNRVMDKIGNLAQVTMHPPLEPQD